MTRELSLQDAQHQLLAAELRAIEQFKEMVRQHVPGAATVVLQSSDQQIGSGFFLDEVLDSRGDTLEVPDALLDGYEHLISDLRWDRAVGEDIYGHKSLPLNP